MKSYFLGANSKDGFFSLYDTFPQDRNAFLHIIKGGPGTGKSSFLRAIAAAAEQQGLEVHRVLCSGDPDSLDGIYLPGRKLAWMDGTAPHVQEPALFGLTGDYIDLTPFFSGCFEEQEKAALRELQLRYRNKYRKAYGLLNACAALGGGKTKPVPDQKTLRELASTHAWESEGTLTSRFLHAITCRGIVQADPLEGYQTEPVSAEQIAAFCRCAPLSDVEMILCPSPLDPKIPEGLLIPNRRLAFLTQPEPDRRAEALLEMACGILQDAKSLHDELEAVYRPHMDFAGLSAYTEQTISQLFPV